MRWSVGLAVFFLVLFTMNGIFIYLAVSGSEPLAASYTAEDR